MKTLSLILLPLNVLAQCLAPPVNHTAYTAHWGFPQECQFFTPEQAQVMPCLGARNRFSQYLRVHVPSPNTYTVTLTSANPNVVFALWDECPSVASTPIVSLHCGGYDCIANTGGVTTMTMTIDAGEYFMWFGLYSDGITCETGSVSMQWQIGGECHDDDEVDVSDCDVTEVGFAAHEHCGCFNTPIAPLPCPNMTQGNYSVVNFTVNYNAPTPIAMTSAMNYTWMPQGQPVYAHAFIMQDGEVVWSTLTGSCSVSAYPSWGTWPAANWEGWIDLPQGQYQVVFGYIGGELGGAQSMTGCAEIVIGMPVLLELLPHELTPSRDHWGKVRSRFSKVVIEGRGVFIRDGLTGVLYDVVTRRVFD